MSSAILTNGYSSHVNPTRNPPIQESGTLIEHGENPLLPHLKIGQVLPIGGENLHATLKDLLGTRLACKDKAPNNRLLPSPLLSDYKGLKLWSKITRIPSYYQARDEIELLEQNGSEIAEHVMQGCTLLDMGSGDVRKIKPLLDRLEAEQKYVNYFALDLSHESLIEAMSFICPQYKHVHCFGLWGTFDDGVKWCKSIPGPRFIFSLGSVMGNDFFEVSVERLRPWADLMRPDDRMLIGMDGTMNLDKVWNSYHDADGLFEKFMRNGLEHTNRLLGQRWYKPEDWEVIGIMEMEPVMHRFVFRARKDVICLTLGLTFEVGDEIDCYEAFKYGPETMRKQFARTNLEEIATWISPSKRIHQYLLRKVAREEGTP